ncbi:AAA family ATPase [Parenemella sanctibonifatiensis]|uniref:AAA family ATPase n=1 Tax=Parenemella sanctibonifatiensis TaxID=2016505 RepID=UPI001E4B7530|nr:AAA family ATPase [Parenemella sanctibonifatiensis]
MTLPPPTPLTTVAVHGYRSLREVVLDLGERLTVVTGANGTGKTSLYRALRLLAEIADGRLLPELAAVGGLSAVLWAGPEHVSGRMRRGEVPVQGSGARLAPVALQLGYASGDLGYLIDLGLPRPDSTTRFSHDPIIKREEIFAGPHRRPASLLVRRHNARVERREDDWVEVGSIEDRGSIIDELGDPGTTPEVIGVRRRVRGWRFYDGWRTDAAAPARQPGMLTQTPVLSADGADLGSAVATIDESDMAGSFAEVIDRALPGSTVRVREVDSQVSIEVEQRGLLRPMAAAELSDGTLRLICLAAALHSPRPPGLLVLNEPEASLHPSVVPAVAAMVSSAASRSQVMVISHAEALVEALSDESDDDRTRHHHLERELGETVVTDQGLLSTPRWDWGSR